MNVAKFPLKDLWDALPQAGWSLPAGRGGRHGGGGLHDGGGHVGHRQRGGGGGVSGQHREGISHQAEVPLHLHAGVVLGRQLQHLQPVVVQAWNLTLERASLVAAADLNGRLAVKDGQLSPWSQTDTQRQKSGGRRERTVEQTWLCYRAWSSSQPAGF